MTHFTLLLGMAAPVWLSNALEGPACGGGGAVVAAEQQQPLWLASLAGILILGVCGRAGLAE